MSLGVFFLRLHKVHEGNVYRKDRIVRLSNNFINLISTRADPSGHCLLGLWVRIPPGAWMSVCCECCVLSGRGLCDELVLRPEESYRVWCV
jgi:hypothetical protein